MRILIAEDDQVLADGLLRTLRSSGAVVSHVANGSEADTALLTRRPARCSSTSSRPSSRADSTIILPSIVATRPVWS